MPHNTHTTSDRNQDLDDGRDLSYYLDLAKRWRDPYPKPKVETCGDFFVVREDMIDGSKARFGSLLVQRMEHDTMVYVAPRHGHAGISLAHLAKRYGKTLYLFMPACKRISENQARAIELGAIPKFYRIAAMPNLNKKAKEWADERGAFFIPLGLRHQLVTAAIVKTAYGLAEEWKGQPWEFWTAMSTGVLSRALQIAWPDALCNGVAVARNIHEGEKGTAKVRSHYLDFSEPIAQGLRPPFPCASNYDAKAWEFMQQHASKGAVFWNVAGDEVAKDRSLFDKIKCNAPWGKLF